MLIPEEPPIEDEEQTLSYIDLKRSYETIGERGGLILTRNKNDISL